MTVITQRIRHLPYSVSQIVGGKVIPISVRDNAVELEQATDSALILQQVQALIDADNVRDDEEYNTLFENLPPA